MNLKSLRNWSERSLANTIALRAAVIAIVSSLVVATISLAVIFWIETRIQHDGLQEKARRVAERVEGAIATMENAVADLTKSPIFASGVLDSRGRDVYLAPFLDNYKIPIAAENGLALCGVNGERLAGTRSLLSECRADSPLFRKVVEHGKTLRELVRLKNGHLAWTVYQGAFFSHIAEVEGVVVTQLDLDELLAPAPSDIDLESVALARADSGEILVSAGTTQESPLTLETVRTPLFKRTASATPFPIDAVARAYQPPFNRKLVPLVLSYFLGGFFLVAWVLHWARRVSLRLIEPLTGLTDIAREIADSGKVNIAVPLTGSGEVGQLAGALQVMIDTIRAAEATLEEKVMLRTAELRYSEALLRESEGRFRTTFENAPVGVITVAPSGRFLAVNQGYCAIVGYNRDELLAMTFMDLTHPDHCPSNTGLGKRTLSGEMPGFSIELQYAHKDGHYVWCSLSATLIRRADGAPDYFIGIVENIERRKHAEDERNEALDRLQRIASQVPGVVYQFRLRRDGSSCFPFASDAIREIYRVTPEEVREDAAKVIAAIHPDDLEDVRATITASMRSLSAWHHEYRVRFDDGTVRWLLGNALPQREADGSVLAHGFITDVTARKQAEAALRVAAAAFEAQEGMFVTDADSVILRVNQAFTDVTGYSAREAVGQTPRLLNSGRHDAGFYARMWDSIRATGSWQGEIWNRRKSGEVYAEWLIVTAVLGAAGEVINYVGTLTDITARKAAEDEIRYLAFYDPLTRLPNRRLLLDRLQQALASRARSGREGALLFIDLDNFKDLNDTLGHDKGDLLLLQVAQRLSGCVREGDTVARLGGDEFVVMLEDLSENPQEAANLVEVVGEKILGTLNQSYLLAGHVYHSTSSIGVTLFADHRNTVDELLKRADLAMYQAKAAGRNTLRFFDPNMQAVVTARTALEADLRQGLRDRQFQLYYQAQVDRDGYPTGVEALVRWHHPQRQLVAPAEFIPLAEETGLILPLGRWVLETACAQLVAWAARPAMAHLTVAVNVSARQIRQPDFVEQVLEVLEQSGADPKKLKLELTESLLLDDVEQTIAKMIVLQDWGVGFSLDDFGTGYSSLSYLKRLPLDQLKIDQSFVRDVLLDPNDAAIARTIVALAQNLGLKVIAEGVEAEAQREFLDRNGCHAYQGYLFSRPLPIERFEAYMAQRISRSGALDIQQE